jgi:hypothetical protein
MELSVSSLLLHYYYSKFCDILDRLTEVSLSWSCSMSGAVVEFYEKN